MKPLALALAAVVLSAATAALAAQVRESDIHIDSGVKKVESVAAGQDVKSEVQVHSVRVQEGAKTGVVSIQGKADKVTTQAGGQTVRATSTVGGVSVGKDH
jgi:hypothetical protein